MDWKDIWTLAEVKNGKLHSVSFELLTWGRGLADARGCRLCSVVLGDQMTTAELKKLIAHGADRVYVVQDAQLAHFVAESHAKVLETLVNTYHPEVFIAAATTTGRTVMPYVAIKTHAGLTADCTQLSIDPESGNLHQTRPAIGGNIMATIKTPTARPQMATVRPKSARPTPPDETRVGEILEVTVPKECFAARMKFEQFLPDLTQDVPLEDADIVVSGGRGMKNKENFAIISRLAESLGGSVGVSRAAVDQGWQPYPRQVGLSGKTVAPELYIACGISGAVQHIVGMQTANTIIAINIDPNAQIFQIADFGIVGDLFIVLPHVIDLINEAKGRSAADV